MLGAIKSFFLPKPKTIAAISEPQATAPSPVIDLHWREDTTWPRPDWDATAVHNGVLDETSHEAWTAAARQWLERMAAKVGDDACLRESREFLLLSTLPDDEAAVFLRYCESVRARILAWLDGIAVPSTSGKHVVVVLDEQDAYYDYISNYDSGGGEYALSSGSFIHAGYGHFLLWRGELDAMEPTVAHELTHCLVSHLPLPLWLNEGIAVNTERRAFPQLAHPNAQQYFPHEMAAKHAAFWNRETIQAFWSGDAFFRPDDGSMLAYDLAAKITALAAHDFDVFRRFVLRAQAADAGMDAANELGYPLEHLIEAVLGEGEWRPRPV